MMMIFHCKFLCGFIHKPDTRTASAVSFRSFSAGNDCWEIPSFHQIRAWNGSNQGSQRERGERKMQYDLSIVSIEREFGERSEGERRIKQQHIVSRPRSRRHRRRYKHFIFIWLINIYTLVTHSDIEFIWRWLFEYTCRSSVCANAHSLIKRDPKMRHIVYRWVHVNVCIQIDVDFRLKTIRVASKLDSTVQKVWPIDRLTRKWAFLIIAIALHLLRFSFSEPPRTSRNSVVVEPKLCTLYGVTPTHPNLTERK